MTVTNHKIVVSGPVGAGKSTAIRVASDAPTLTTDVRASDDVRDLKDLTTIALDHGAFDLTNGDRVHLYGTPGQERFDFMWEIISQGAAGLALLIPNDQPDPLADLRFFVRAFEPILRDCDGDIVVGVTHMDRSCRPTLDQHRAVLADLGRQVPVLAIDARCQQDVRRLVDALLAPVDARETA
jgi:signal recognition particle receptor subunit beta